MPLGPVEYFRSCGHDLYPVQRFLLKLMYGEPLDAAARTIEIRDPIQRAPHARLSELGYLRFLQLQGRINISDMPNPRGYRRTLFAMGRRTGKSHLTSLVQAYEAYLFEEEGTGTYAGLTLALRLEMARSLARDFRNVVARNQLISRETSARITCGLGGRTSTFNFRDMHHALSHGATLNSLVYDEVAYGRHILPPRVEDLQGTARVLMSATPGQTVTESFMALYPAVALQGRVMLVSTPNGHDPFFYHHYQRTRNSDEEWLTLRIPTWEASPLLTSQVFLEYNNMNPDTFDREFGANFDAPAMASAQIEAESIAAAHQAEIAAIPSPLKSRFHIIEEFND